MANQIKKKYIENNAIDGEKLKLVKGQSVRGEDQSGQEVDLLKLNQDDKVLLKGEEAALKSQVDAEQQRAEGEEARIEGKVDQEVLDRESGDSALQSQITALQGAGDVLFEDNAGVYADATAPIEDPTGRDGWFYKSAGSPDKINWYFHDGQTNPVTVGQFKTLYTVATVDSSSNDTFHLAYYTFPLGDGQDAGSWYRSRIVYVPSGSFERGVKTLFYMGQEPDASVYPDLPRVQMTVTTVAGSNAGLNEDTEVIMTSVLGTNSGADADTVKILVNKLGFNSSVYNKEYSLEIRGEFTLAGIKQSLLEEAIERQNADGVLQDNIDVEKSRIDAILAASEADKDSFAEIVSLINSVDTENDQAFAGYVSSNDDRSTQIETSVSEEILDRTNADNQLQDNIDSEEAARIAGDEALDGRLSPIEGMLEYKHSSLQQDAQAVYADAMKGKEDPSALIREGWYYTNDDTPYTNVYGQPGDNKINWYFYYQDGINPDVTLGDFSAYAVMTFDDASESPILAVYTPASGSGDAASWYHSRVVYSGLSSTPVVGKKYVVYFGQEPEIHPELPRLELSKSNISSVGDQNPTEIVGFASFGTNSTAPVGSVKFMVESLGVHSPEHKTNVKLKIHHATQEEFDALQSQVDALDGNFATDEELAQAVSNLQAADSTLQSNIDIEKGRIDAILDASEADKDSFKEIVDLINSVDTENDSAFAGYVSSNDDRVDTLESEMDAVETSIAQEALARETADDIIDGRLASLESYEYETETRTLAQEDLAEINFDKQIVEKSMVLSVGRLMLIKGIDYSLEVGESGTKLTFIGSVAQGGEEALSEGEILQAVYEYKTQM